MNSNMVKPEKFGYLHLVYPFTVPLNTPISKVEKLNTHLPPPPIVFNRVICKVFGFPQKFQVFYLMKK